MGRSNSHEKLELKKGPWTREEDQKLLAFIEEHGHGSWRALPAKAGLQRCGKSCRLRWTNYLRPDIKRGKFSSQEEKAIIRLHALLGNRWSAIATHLPKRTDNEIKNYWNTRLKKRLTRMGIDPATHKPKDNLGGSSRHAAVVSHMAQWETARLEAEARLVRECKLLTKLQLLHKTVVSPPLQPVGPPCLDVLKVWQATASQNGGFFGSAGSLESPTSTLNFAGNSSRVPKVGPRGCSNDAVSGVGKVNGSMEVKGKLDNSVGQLVHDNNIAYPMDYNYNYNYNLQSSMEIEGYNNSISPYHVGDFEDNKNYWNELFNLVSSPLGSPVF
ncbi:hypothetical protein DH2020_032447 [Rehmannia glutinosa]|uniref:R2R3-MYB protein n=1 Tax=Rehmannia glutinosa TaxID=99300 RepID=A0ABR0VHW9_REHGL